MSARPDRTTEELADLVFQVAERLRGGFHAAAAEMDLPPAQALLLIQLSEPHPMRALADMLGCDASNVTGIVDGLERRGLAIRRPSPDDRRVKHVVLTEEGERRRAALRERSTAEAAVLFDLPDGRRDLLRELLDEVAAR
ncbi:MarR family winged helix-turn-helix transcriptional regulator [Actinomadura kijaniata]|uniref:MarR family winged helix-turn-helix transcriptional regulator n=1 Tax=Actinomadura kijaniata TaxID=46161 RepID=UPI001C3F2DFD|nr:MarR family transcriptional regulator [Actinomadura kijaniata]